MLRLRQTLTDRPHLLLGSAIKKRLRQLSRKRVNNHLLRGLLDYPARAQVETFAHRQYAPTVAPWLHFTSSA